MSTDTEIFAAIDQAVEGNATFSELLTVEDKQYLMNHGAVRSFPAGEMLCHQYQRDDRVYIVVLGEVEVSEEVEGRSVTLARLGRGELFGEIAALFGVPRVSDVRVSKPSVLLEIRGAVLDRLIESRPGIRRQVIQRSCLRITQTALRAVAPFRALPEEAVRILENDSALVSYPEGSEIVREGETGESFYIIIYGIGRVKSSAGGDAVNIALLRPGEYFGEWSLLTGSPRTATVVAATQVEVLQVDCAAFLEFMQQYPDVHDRIDRVAHNRHEVVSYTSAYPESARKRQVILDRIEDTVKSDERFLAPH